MRSPTPGPLLCSLSRNSGVGFGGRRAWRRWLNPWLGLIAPASCGVCRQLQPLGSSAVFCADCEPRGAAGICALEGLEVAYGGLFEAGLREAVLKLKYQAQPELAPGLGRWLAGRLEPLFLGVADQAVSRPVLLPVPLHDARLVQRGYNQAGLIASAVGSSLGLRVRHRALKRLRETAVQASLKRAERAHNALGAFEASHKLIGQPVVLVDDVATTGATLNACQAALLRVGAQPLGALVVALADKT